MTSLSPAAQEVDNAIADIEAQIELADLASGFNAYRKAVAAAALRAAADQVMPIEPLHGGDQRWETERDARQICRRKLLAIAAELEGAQ